jgi:hypothetical protein
MKDISIASTDKIPGQYAPFKIIKAKEQWINATRIKPLASVDWLTAVYYGNTTEFTASFAVHKFEIKLPFSYLTNERHAFLTRVALDVSLVGDAALTAVELFEGKHLLWADTNSARRGGRLIRQPSDRFWKIRPEALVTDDLRLQLAVFFGAPNVTVPQFHFRSVVAGISSTEVF